MYRPALQVNSSSRISFCFYILFRFVASFHLCFTTNFVKSAYECSTNQLVIARWPSHPCLQVRNRLGQGFSRRLGLPAVTPLQRFLLPDKVHHDVPV